MDQRCGLRLGGHRLTDRPLGRGQFVQARDDQRWRHVEDLRGVGYQVGRGQVAVPVVGRLGQGVGQAGLDSPRAVGGDPTAAAIWAAVLNPMLTRRRPAGTARCGRRRSSRRRITVLLVDPLHYLWIRAASDVDTPTLRRKIITSLIASCSAQAAAIIAMRLGPSLSTSTS
jgi:hypothetical protein